MRRYGIVLLGFLLVFVLFAGCSRTVPDDKAEALLKELALLLVTSDKNSVEELMPDVEKICAKFGVTPADLSGYLDSHAEAKQKLIDLAKQEVDSILKRKEEENKKKIEEKMQAEMKKLKEAQAESEKRLQALRDEYKVKMEKAKEEHRKKILRLKRQIQNLKRALEEQ